MNLMLRGSPLQAGVASLVSPLVGFASTLQCTHHTGAACHCSLLRVHPSLGAASLYSAISPLVGFGCTPAWRGLTTLWRVGPISVVSADRMSRPWAIGSTALVPTC